MEMKALNLKDLKELALYQTDASKLWQELLDIRSLLKSFYQIFEYSSNGIYLIDGNGIMRFFNRAYEQMTGFHRSELIGKHCSTLEENGRVDYSVANICLNEKKEITQDLFFPLTGRLITISTKLIYSEEGKIEALIGNLIDITDVIYRRSHTSNDASSFSQQQKDIFIRQFQKSPSMIAKSEKMQWLLYYAQKASQTDTNILITGETGTGKEEMARFIHENSQYKDGPFITVNCGAIPNELIESELFGYGPGAFTGATREGKEGLFEAANNGTIFLDEIAELPYQVQASLLRVLQERTVSRIGTVRKIHLNIRILAATNQDLKRNVEEKKFREDLYYRINVVPIQIPPLRERKEDILPLCMHFLEISNKKQPVWHSLSPSAIATLQTYNWPGNIRELRNVLERASALCEGHVIEKELLFDEKTLAEIQMIPGISDMEGTVQSSVFASQGLPPAPGVGDQWECNLSSQIADYEYSYLKAYYEHYGSIRNAAAALHMDRSTFQRKLATYRKSKKDPLS